MKRVIAFSILTGLALSVSPALAGGETIITPVMVEQDVATSSSGNITVLLVALVLVAAIASR